MFGRARSRLQRDPHVVTVLDDDLLRLAGGRHHDPFAVLGKHAVGDRVAVVRAHIPTAIDVMIAEGEIPLERIGNSDLFEWRGEPSSVPDRYRLIWRDTDHREHIAHDPYVYPPLLSEADLDLFARGAHRAPYEFLGAREHEIDGVAGVLFAVWAPNAERVSVVGDFNHWDGRRHPMRVRHNGVWELFVPDLAPGALYKYETRNRDSGALFLKADPYGRLFERRPQTASIVP